MSAILGIESTAHTFGIGIAKNRRILANVKKSYTTERGGIILSEAARHHEKYSKEIYNNALKISGIKESEIQGVAFSQGPGLTSCLLVGLEFAKNLARKLNVPLIPVNHCVAHLEIGSLFRAKDAVMLYASGANTQIIAYASGRYRIFGETLDIGVGNFLDNFARYLEIGFPGGPKIEQLALHGKNYIELPYKVKGMDIAVSGILTNLKQKIEKTKKDFGNSNWISWVGGEQIRETNLLNSQRAGLRIRGDGRWESYVNDLSFSAQETVFAMLVEISERALAHVGKKELLLGGGVGCNKRLQEMCKIMCASRKDGTKFFVPENQFLVDNGAMIAFLGEIMFKSGIKFSGKQATKLEIKPKQRTDEVEVSWRK